MPSRIFRMVVSTGAHYLEGEKGAVSTESHFTAALGGDIHSVRREFAEFGVREFQEIYREIYGVDLDPGEIRIGFEREGPATEPSPNVHVQTAEMIYRGNQHFSRRFPSQVLAYDNYDPAYIETENSDNAEENDDEEAYEDDNEADGE